MHIRNEWQQLQAGLRVDLLRRMWLGFGIAALVLTPLSVLRTRITGWLPIYSLHLGLAALVLLAWWGQRRLPLGLQTALMLGLYWIIGLAGLFTFGLLAPGVFLLLLAGLLGAVLVSPRAGLYSVVAAALLMLVAAFGFVSGALESPVRSVDYLRDPGAWGNFVATCVVLSTVMALVIGGYQTALLAQLRRSVEQQQQIETLNNSDRLTGLLYAPVARERLQDLLQRAGTGQLVGCVLIEVRDLPLQVREHGHSTCDRLLQGIAARLQQFAAAGDLTGRLADNHLLWASTRFRDLPDLTLLAERLADELKHPIDCDGLHLSPAFHIGIAVHPQHGDGAANALLDRALAALESARRYPEMAIMVAG
jgi:GGDEF domain-containing protein